MRSASLASSRCARRKFAAAAAIRAADECIAADASTAPPWFAAPRDAPPPGLPARCRTRHDRNDGGVCQRPTDNDNLQRQPTTTTNLQRQPTTTTKVNGDNGGGGDDGVTDDGALGQSYTFRVDHTVNMVRMAKISKTILSRASSAATIIRLPPSSSSTAPNKREKTHRSWSGRLHETSLVQPYKLRVVEAAWTEPTKRRTRARASLSRAHATR